MQKIALKDLMTTQIIVFVIIIALFSLDIAFGVFISGLSVQTVYLMIHKLTDRKTPFNALEIEMQSQIIMATSLLVGIYWFFYEPEWYRQTQERYRELSIKEEEAKINSLLLEDSIDMATIEVHLENLKNLGINPKRKKALYEYILRHFETKGDTPDAQIFRQRYLPDS